MMLIKTFDRKYLPTKAEQESIALFLFAHLEAYGDPLSDIEKCIRYAIQETHSPGGLIVTAHDGETMTGAVIMNRTGMSGYIPENILVYIATHKDYRGKGIGRQLMAEAILRSEGNIALHVEAHNPARKLYESLGFTNKYLEMRLSKE